ncbi:hypothetical protein ACV3RY_16385 [Clostridium perfringens]
MKFIKIATIFVPIVATASLAYVYVKKSKEARKQYLHIKTYYKKDISKLNFDMFFLI